MKLIKSDEGIPIMIDNEDYDKVSKYRWYVLKNASSISIRNTHNVYMTQIIMEHINGNGHILHIDGNPLNNQKYNLYKRRYKGVYFQRKGNYIGYQAKIKYNNTQIYIGTYYTELEAAIAYNIKAIQLLGDKAKLNKLD